MEEKRNFERALKDFRSPAEEKWRSEMSDWEYAYHVWRRITWTEVVGNVVAVVSIATIAFGLLLLG